MHLAGTIIEHFLQGSALLRLWSEQFLHENVPLKHLLNEETLFMSWQRSAIKEVNDWALSLRQTKEWMFFRPFIFFKTKYLLPSIFYFSLTVIKSLLQKLIIARSMILNEPKNHIKSIFDEFLLLVLAVAGNSWTLGVQVRNMKMDINTGGTWHRVGQWTLMMKTYDFC